MGSRLISQILTLYVSCCHPDKGIGCSLEMSQLKQRKNMPKFSPMKTYTDSTIRSGNPYTCRPKTAELPNLPSTYYRTKEKLRGVTYLSGTRAGRL